MVNRRLVVKIAGESDRPERMQTGLSVAAAAGAAGIGTALWLAGDAVWLATRPDAKPSGVRPSIPAETSALFGAARETADLAVCARCAGRRGIEDGHLIDGAAIAGAAAFAAAVTEPGVQALIY